jgi:tRNA threonylcarbamoyl adenosine modification protein (Sua5/YciO/YrdC/YwlC family)
MGAELLNIHSKTPESRKISQVAKSIDEGAVILYPVDTGFALGCKLEHKEAISRIRRIRNLPDNQALTFLCEDLSKISEFAKVSNDAYKTIKGLIPGPYTFILPASKLVPKFAQNPKRNTAGIRVPNNRLTEALLSELGKPIIAISAKINTDRPILPDEIIDEYKNLVDIVVSSDEYNFSGESTIIDMTTDAFEITREGAGIDKVKHFLIA